MAPVGSDVWMLSHQGGALFEKEQRGRRCGLVGGSKPLGASFEVPKSLPWLFQNQAQCLSLLTGQDVISAASSAPCLLVLGHALPP